MDDYEAKVKQQIERLSTWSFQEIEATVTAQRIAWLQEHAHPYGAAGSISPREAFERLFFDYMGLSPADLPVIEENVDKITWLSKNPCPTLDACLQLGLDTREVCRETTERATRRFSPVSIHNCASSAATSKSALTPLTAWRVLSRLFKPWFIRSAV